MSKDDDRLEQALAEYAKVLEKNPDDERVLLRVAELSVRGGRTQEAVGMYLKVASIYTEQGFLLKAVAVYKNILLVDEGCLEAKEELAALYRQLGLRVAKNGIHI
jgi:tetratricopeptide (TPR) repeat protein